MNVCIDIGNSFIKIANVVDGEVLNAQKFETKKYSKQDLQDILARFEGDRVLIASVVPWLTEDFKAASDREVCLVTSEHPPLPITHKSIGADVLAYASYVAENFPLPATIFSLGTATVCMHISEKKGITGGLIMPGINSGLYGLMEKTSQLTNIIEKETGSRELVLTPTKDFMALDTLGAINNGIFYQTLATIDFLSNKLGAKTNVVCGGGSNLVKDDLPDDFIIDEFLVIRGIDMIFS